MNTKHLYSQQSLSLDQVEGRLSGERPEVHQQKEKHR